jgi:adenylate cyclase
MNVLQFVQNTERIIETAGELIRSAEELGFKAWAAWGHTTAGWARAKGGLTSSGMSQIEHGLALFRGAGVKILQPFHLALAAEVSMALGARVDARGYLDQALDQIEQWGERWFAPEAYRMMGILMAAEDLPAEAEKWFDKALHEARRQNTKGWELRAALSQAQLMQHQGRSEAAAALLGPVYNWFTEGFATSDLTQARALLATGPAAP